MSDRKLIKAKPTDPSTPRLANLFDEFEELMDPFFPVGPVGLIGGSRWNWPSFGLENRVLLPRIDLIDREMELVVKAAVPGFDKDEIEVTVADDQLTLSAKSKRTEESKDELYYHKEIKAQHFLRTIALPTAVDGSKATAGLKDGMLELHLPKTERTTRRTISIK